MRGSEGQRRHITSALNEINNCVMKRLDSLIVNQRLLKHNEV